MILEREVCKHKLYHGDPETANELTRLLIQLKSPLDICQPYIGHFPSIDSLENITESKDILEEVLSKLKKKTHYPPAIFHKSEVSGMQPSITTPLPYYSSGAGAPLPFALPPGYIVHHPADGSGFIYYRPTYIRDPMYPSIAGVPCPSSCKYYAGKTDGQYSGSIDGSYDKMVPLLSLPQQDYLQTGKSARIVPGGIKTPMDNKTIKSHHISKTAADNKLRSAIRLLQTSKSQSEKRTPESPTGNKQNAQIEVREQLAKIDKGLQTKQKMDGKAQTHDNSKQKQVQIDRKEQKLQINGKGPKSTDGVKERKLRGEGKEKSKEQISREDRIDKNDSTEQKTQGKRKDQKTLELNKDRKTVGDRKDQKTLGDRKILGDKKDDKAKDLSKDQKARGDRMEQNTLGDNEKKIINEKGQKMRGDDKVSNTSSKNKANGLVTKSKINDLSATKTDNAVRKLKKARGTSSSGFVKPTVGFENRKETDTQNIAVNRQKAHSQDGMLLSLINSLGKKEDRVRTTEKKMLDKSIILPKINDSSKLQPLHRKPSKSHSKKFVEKIDISKIGEKVDISESIIECLLQEEEPTEMIKSIDIVPIAPREGPDIKSIKPMLFEIKLDNNHEKDQHLNHLSTPPGTEISKQTKSKSDTVRRSYILITH
jgi:hypothetical protein